MIRRLIVAGLVLGSAAVAVPGALAEEGGGGSPANIAVGGTISVVTPDSVTIHVTNGALLPTSSHLALPDGFVGHDLTAHLATGVRVWVGGKLSDPSALAVGEHAAAAIQASAPISAASSLEVEVIGVVPLAPPAATPAPPAGGRHEPEHGTGSPPEHDGTPGAARPSGDGATTPNPAPGAIFGREWRLAGDVLGVDTTSEGGVIDLDVSSVLGGPRRLREAAAGVLEGEIDVVVGPRTTVIRVDGQPATLADVPADGSVRVAGRLLPKAQWLTDADGAALPTLRARRVKIVA